MDSRLLKFILLLATVGVLANCTSNDNWKTVYQDDYKYNTAQPYSARFNTWFWREDAIGTHRFNYIGQDKCTQKRPCVKLIAPISIRQGYPKDETPYINGEMYNNSCVRQGSGHPDKQPYDELADLGENPWDTVLYAHQPKEVHQLIGKSCDKPYPYRQVQGTDDNSYAANSWNTTTPGRLTANKVAQWIDPEKENWQKFRDFAFNTPYRTDAKTAQRIDITIKAEGKAGGSRGWGYWNTTMSPIDMQFAWFMEIALQEKEGKVKTATTYMMTVVGKDDLGICITPLPDSVSIYDWHDYRIEWSQDAVKYFVDGELYARHTKYIPDLGLSFHNWTDNRNYNLGKKPANFPLYIDKSNYIYNFTASEKQIEMSASSTSPPVFATSALPTKCSNMKNKGEQELQKLLKAIMAAYK